MLTTVVAAVVVVAVMGTALVVLFVLFTVVLVAVMLTMVVAAVVNGSKIFQRPYPAMVVPMHVAMVQARWTALIAIFVISLAKM